MADNVRRGETADGNVCIGWKEKVMDLFRLSGSSARLVSAPEV